MLKGRALIDGPSGIAHSYEQAHMQRFRFASAVRSKSNTIGDKAAVPSGKDAGTVAVVLAAIRPGLAWIPLGSCSAAAENGPKLRRFACDIFSFKASSPISSPRSSSRALHDPKLDEYVNGWQETSGI